MIVSYTHSFSAGHRIVGYPGDCRMIHGHNYQATVFVAGPIGEDGMVVDYGEMKRVFGGWIDKEWDHRLLLWEEDPVLPQLHNILQKFDTIGSVKAVPFNPTAENMAAHLLKLNYPWPVARISVKEGEKTEAVAQ